MGAFGATGNKASYSNYGDWIDIAAPGGDAKQGIYSTLLYNNYGGADWQGTSMACPHVSGVAALLVSYFGGPGFTAEECRSRIIRGAVSGAITGSRYVGRKLDAYGAFTCDPGVAAQAPVMAWKGDHPSEIGYKDQVEIPFTVTDPLGLLTWVSLSPEVAGISLLKDSETEYRLVIDAETLGSGSFSVKLTAKNEDEAVSSLSYAFTVIPNRPPMPNVEKTPTVIFDAPGESQSVSAADWINDPDGDPLTFEATIEDPSVATLTAEGNGNMTLQGLRPGRTQVLVNVSDGVRTSQICVLVAVRNPAGSYIYPTTVTRSFHVAVNESEAVPVKIEIFTASGVSVKSADAITSIFNPVSVSVGSLSPGVYTVKITCPDSERTVTFVKI